MDERRYSEKETAILNGIIDLIKNGENPYSIKVSDIALSAGVGKGTIYDYFETKEEVISKAILFNMDKEIEQLIKRIHIRNGFKEKIYEIFHIIIENLENKFSTFNILMTAENFPEFHHKNSQENCGCYSHIARIQGFIEDLLTCGYDEGKIKEIEGEYYGKMVIKSSLLSFINYLTMKNMYKNTNMNEAMDSAYHMVIKSLN